MKFLKVLFLFFFGFISPAFAGLTEVTNNIQIQRTGFTFTREYLFNEVIAIATIPGNARIVRLSVDGVPDQNSPVNGLASIGTTGNPTAFNGSDGTFRYQAALGYGYTYSWYKEPASTNLVLSWEDTNNGQTGTTHLTGQTIYIVIEYVQE